MDLLEYEAKKLLSLYGVPVPRSALAIPTGAPFIPCIIKSQIPVGGRGKAGGVRIVTDQVSATRAIKDILALEIKGHTPRVVLCEELIDIAKELYFSIMINRSTSRIEIAAHPKGGIEIESHEKDEFYRRALSPHTVRSVGQELADYYDLPEKAFLLTDLLEKIYRCFTQSDVILLEINPLVLTSDGNFVAGDCKMTLDNAARFRHDDWDFEEDQSSANFVTLNKDGTIATIANGAGLAMATVDAVKDVGLTPANFLDIGGNATTEGILESFNQLVKFNNLTNIVINIFGGIVRCDTVARAIIEARRAIPSLPTLQIRLSGTNSIEARALLEKEGLVLHDTLESCLTEITQ